MDDRSPAWSRTRRTLVKSAVLLCAVTFRTYVPFAVLGIWNRLFGGWRSIFFCYAGSHNFISSYAPPATVDLFRWHPSPIGVLRQNGSRGLVLAAPVTEQDFLDPANAEQFRKLRLRLRLAARLMGAEQVSLAGILPGILRNDDVLNIPDTREVVIAAVRHAVDEVTARCFDSVSRNVIVLGGCGYVGRPVTEELRASGYECHVVDPRTRTNRLPAELENKPALLLDISRYGAIDTYVSQMWPGLVVLNETFPRPSRRSLEAMSAQGVDVFHVSGITGTVRPPLPFGYEDAVPCCAAHAPPGPGEVRIVQLAKANETSTRQCQPAATGTAQSGRPPFDALTSIN